MTSPPDTMRAAWIERFGEGVHIGRRPTPVPGARDVLVEVHAASVNPRDFMIRDGTYIAKPLLPRLPFILGSDIAGVVAGHGAELDPQAASTPPLGARVAAMVPSRGGGFGAFAEYTAVRGDLVATLPDTVDFIAGAATPLAALTALQALRDVAGLGTDPDARPRVAVLGASGGVGSFAVQIARRLGAEEVVGVASGPNEELVRDLGATDFVDYRARDPRAVIRDVDIVFDVVGRSSLDACAAMLRPGGTYVTTIPSPKRAWHSLRTRLLGLVSRTARQSRMVVVSSHGEDLRQLVSWLADGSLRAVIDRTAPLEESGELLEYCSSFHTRGKNVVVVVDDD